MLPFGAVAIGVAVVVAARRVLGRRRPTAVPDAERHTAPTRLHAAIVGALAAVFGPLRLAGVANVVDARDAGPVSVAVELTDPLRTRLHEARDGAVRIGRALIHSPARAPALPTLSADARSPDVRSPNSASASSARTRTGDRPRSGNRSPNTRPRSRSPASASATNSASSRHRSSDTCARSPATRTHSGRAPHATARVRFPRTPDPHANPERDAHPRHVALHLPHHAKELSTSWCKQAKGAVARG